MTGMRFRLGLVIGAGIGYVLGTRAGRERYEELMAMWERAQENPKFADIAAATEAPREQALRLLGDGIHSVSDLLRKQSSGPPPAGR